MKTKEIEKLIDDLYFECIAHEELDEAFQIGMDIYRDRLKEAFKELFIKNVNSNT